MPNHPPHVARLIEKGKASTITTISGAPVLNEDTHELIMSTMNGEANVDFTNEVTSAQCHQLAAITGHRLVALSFSKMMRVSNETQQYTLTASCSDSLSTPAPCTFDRGILQENFVALVPKAFAQKFGLAVSTIDPEDVGNRDGSIDGSLGRLAIEGYFTLPTEDDGDDGGFVFAALPRLFRLTPGKPIPAGTSLDDLGDTLATSYPELHMWCSAHRWLKDKNNTRAINSNDGTMFPEDVLAADLVPPSTLSTMTLAPNPQVTITMLAPGDGLYHRTLSSVTDKCDMLYRDLGAAMPQDADLPTNGTAGTAGGISDEILRLATTVMQDLPKNMKDVTTSAKTAENKERTELAKVKAAIMFARIGATAGNPDTKRLIAAELTDHGTDMFSKTRFASVQLAIRQAMKRANDDAGVSDKAIDDMVSLSETIVNARFTQAHMEMLFIDQPLNNLPESSLTSALSLLAWLPVRSETSSLPHEDSLQVMSTEDQLDQVRNSKIYIKGTLHSPTHLRMMIASFLKYWGIIVADIDHSTLATCLLEWFDALKQPYTKEWFAQIEEQHVAPVLANLAATISSDVIRPFVRLSLSTDYRRAIEKGDPIAADGLQRAIDGHKTALREFGLCVTRGIPGIHYTQAPRLMEHLNVPVIKSRKVVFDLTSPTSGGSERAQGKPASKAKDNRKDNKKQSSSNSGSDKNKKPRTSPDLETRKTLGILVYKKDGAVPDAPPKQPDIRTKAFNTKGRAEKLCMDFITRGYACSKEGCQKAHVANLGQVNANIKEKIKTFVNNTDGLSFAEGKAPDGETPA